MKNRTLIIISLLLFVLTAPAVAIGIGDVVGWVSNQTGLTDKAVSYIGGLIILPILGFITKKLDWAKWERAVYVGVYGFSQKVNDAIVSVPILGMVWEKWLEPYFIKLVAGLFRVIGQIPLATAAGFNSRGESLAGK